jgi:cellulose synthase/poly-beta-1,6-N-acetylglucosamine synthase-like glycosyltransferase
VSRPRLGMSLAVAALLAGAGAGHVLYPAWLAWRTRGSPPRPARPGPARRPQTGAAPTPLTVLVPAYREAGVIGAKVEDIRANGYAGPLDILVIADGDPETAAAAEAAGARALTGPERLGKSQALNRGFAEADTAIVVITDANNRLAPGALAAVVEHFDDPRVGAVAGEKLEDDGGGGESLYWRFESWLKQREDELGTTIGLIGELSAVRAEAWRPIPPDVAIDDLWAGLDIIEQGYRVAYEPRARALDPAAPSMAVQWERRTRNVSGALHVLARRRRQLRPSAGLVAAELWGHRLVRFTVSPLSHLALIALAASKVRSSTLARLFLLANAAACTGLVASARPARPAADAAKGPGSRNLMETAAAGAGQVMFLQGVALGGMARYARGDRPTMWSTVER